MLNSIDRLRAWAFGQLIEKHALAADWEGMRRLELNWVRFSENYHGRDRTELCQTERDARLTTRGEKPKQRHGNRCAQTDAAAEKPNVSACASKKTEGHRSSQREFH